MRSRLISVGSIGLAGVVESDGPAVITLGVVVTMADGTIGASVVVPIKFVINAAILSFVCLRAAISVCERWFA